MKKHRPRKKGLSDADLVKKYESGKIDLKKAVKIMTQKPNSRRLSK